MGYVEINLYRKVVDQYGNPFYVYMENKLKIYIDDYFIPWHENLYLKCDKNFWIELTYTTTSILNIHIN